MPPSDWRLIDRFKEPSSWNAIGVLLAGVGVNIPTGLGHGIALIGAGVCIILGFVLKEGKSQ